MLNAILTHSSTPPSVIGFPVYRFAFKECELGFRCFNSAVVITVSMHIILKSVIATFT